MFPQYIPSLVMILLFVSGFGAGALIFGGYCLRGWEREIESARRERELSRKTGVYRIRNTVIGAFYIGSTTRAFAARWGEHVGDLEAGKHTSAALQRDWQIYGPDAFSFEIVEIMPGDEKHIREHEQKWIVATQRRYPKCFIYNSGPFRRTSPIGDTR